MDSYKPKPIHNEAAGMRIKTKSKKGFSPPIYLLIVIVLLSIMVFVYFSGWNPLFGKLIKTTKGYIDDCDKDGIEDNSDTCACDTSEKGSRFNSGCPEGYTIRGDDSGREDKSCLKKGCPKTT